MFRKFFATALLVSLTASALPAQSREQWVDSVFNAMTLDEKIGQLFTLRVPTNADRGELGDLADRIKATSPGGILFSDLRIDRDPIAIRQLQTTSSVPLLIGLDSRTGIIGIDSSLALPPLHALGALANDSLIFLAGRETGRRMRLMGVNLGFIPANLAGNESGMGSPSFGDDHINVANKSLAYWKGLQSAGMLACAKYFPIQGLRITDVQKGVPSVQLTVDSTQAHPFKVLLKNKLPALMPASSDLPMFYDARKAVSKNVFSSGTLSAAFAGEWIRVHMNYNGLFIVDVKSMEGSRKFKAGDAEVFAFQAGNDILVTADNIAPAIRKMKKLLRTEKAFALQVDASVKKILGMKYDAGLAAKFPQPPGDLPAALHTRESRLLRKQLYEAIPTLVANQRNTLPVQSLENKTFTCILVDDDEQATPFTSLLNKYVRANTLRVSTKTDSIALPDLSPAQHVVIVAVFPGTKESSIRKLLYVLQEPLINREIVVCDFGSPALAPYVNHFPTLLVANAADPDMMRVIPQIIFGGLPAIGKLPVQLGPYQSGTHVVTEKIDRLTYSFPEDAGIDSKTLTKIASIANEAIDIKATPGCHVLVAKNGKVVYEESFGHLTYEKQAHVTHETIYDLASVTKVTATLQAVMFMHDKGLIDINKKASVYLPELKQSNKKDFTLKDILTHQAGLWPFLPFWAQTMKDTVYLPQFYSRKLSPEFPLVVADRLFGSRAMKDSLWHWIINARIREKPDRTPFDYRYSDMGFYILHHLSERLLNQPMEDFLAQNLYEPLGATTTGYLPLLNFPVTQIAPTENDKLFRRSLLIGTVHDQGAAMHGGIAGHAGLFSNANDLAKLGQMLLQEGHYGGLQYYKPETVRLFTQKQFANSRRGLGWDKPTQSDWNGPTASQASPLTFGHTGFTGTCIWIDPEFDLVYIFLSNRVHPDMTNNKLLSANIRSRIQEVIYEAIFNFCKTADDGPVPSNVGTTEAFGGSQ